MLLRPILWMYKQITALSYSYSFCLAITPLKITVVLSNFGRINLNVFTASVIKAISSVLLVENHEIYT